MKKLLIVLSFFLSSSVFADESWNKSLSKDESGKEYQVYSLLSLNSDKEGHQAALILVSPKENIMSKIGFAQTDGAIDCVNYCQYYIQFDNTAAKYKFVIENKSIKLDNSQKEDFLNNVKNSKEMILILDKKKFYFNVQNPNWKFTPEADKK